MLLQLSQIFRLYLLPPHLPSTPTPSAFPTLSSMSMSPHICSLVTLFPMTSPWPFTTYQFVLFSSPHLFHPSHLTTIKMFSVSMILFLFCLFILFFRFNCWQICIYCHFIVDISYLLLLKEDPLTFHIIIVWSWWTLTFSCLGSSLSVRRLQTIALLGRVILVVGSCFSSLWISLSNPF